MTVLVLRSHLDTKVTDKFLPFHDGAGAGAVMLALAKQIFSGEEVVFDTLSYKSGNKLSFAVVSKNINNSWEDLKKKYSPTKILVCGGYTHSLLNGIHKSTPVSKARGLLYMIDDVLAITTIGVENLQAKSNGDANSLEFARDFIADAEKLHKHHTMPELPIIHRKIAQSHEELRQELAYITNASAISLDIETSNLVSASDSKAIPDFMIDELFAVGIGALYEGHNMSYSITVPRQLLVTEQLQETANIFKAFFEIYTGRVVLHNALFDLPFLIKHFDYDFLSVDVADTMLMAAAIDERASNQRIGGLSLKFLSAYYFNIPDFSFDWKKFYSAPDAQKDWDSLYYYLGYDTHCTIALYHVLNQELVGEDGLNNVLNTILFPACTVLSHIMLDGMPIDRDFLLESMQGYETKLQDLFQQSFIPEGFNPNSTQEVKAVLESLGQEVAKTDEETLQTIVHSGDSKTIVLFAEQLLQYRKYSKLIGTYFKPFLEQSELDSKIHGRFSLRGTRTGRLSSNSPNLQNIPKTDDYIVRRAFYAPKGYQFVEVDYSQLELRVMAVLSGDTNLKTIYLKNEDLHTKSAAAIFGKTEDVVTTEERSLAKIFNFGIIYGRGARGIVRGKEMQELKRQGKQTMDEKEAQKAIDAYLDTYPGIRDYMERMRKQAETKHYVESLFGRKRRFPVITKQNWWKIKNQAPNMPDQSTAGDFTLWSIVTLFPLLREKYGNKCHIINTVHDSILFLIHESILNDALNTICPIMENPPIDCKNVPITVDVDLGKNWGELEAYGKHNFVRSN